MQFPKMHRKEDTEDDLWAKKNIEAAQMTSLVVNLPRPLPADINASHNLNFDEDERPHHSRMEAARESLRHKSLAVARQSLRRGSLFMGERKEKKKEKPTYQLGPLHGQYFSWLKAKNIVEMVSHNHVLPCENIEYDPAKISVLLKLVANTILKKLKMWDFPRYKYVCQTTSMQLRGQGGQMSSRHLWSPETDRCFHLTKHCKHFVVVISLYALYFE